MPDAEETKPPIKPKRHKGEFQGVKYTTTGEVSSADVAWVIEKMRHVVRGRRLRGDLTLTFPKDPWLK